MGWQDFWAHQRRLTVVYHEQSIIPQDVDNRAPVVVGPYETVIYGVMSENMRKSWSSSLPSFVAICYISFPTEDVVGLQPRHTLQTIRIISSSVPLGLFDTTSISPRWENENAKTNDRWGHSRIGQSTGRADDKNFNKLRYLGPLLVVSRERTLGRGTEGDCLCVKFPIHVGNLCSGSNFNIYLKIIQVSCSRAWKVDRKSLYALIFFFAKEKIGKICSSDSDDYRTISCRKLALSSCR